VSPPANLLVQLSRSLHLRCHTVVDTSAFAWPSTLLIPLNGVHGVSVQATTTKRDYDYLFKLVIIGDSGVGKSSLLLRFAVRPSRPCRPCRRGTPCLLLTVTTSAMFCCTCMRCAHHRLFPQGSVTSACWRLRVAGRHLPRLVHQHDWRGLCTCPVRTHVCLPTGTSAPASAAVSVRSFLRLSSHTTQLCAIAACLERPCLAGRLSLLPVFHFLFRPTSLCHSSCHLACPQRYRTVVVDGKTVKLQIVRPASRVM
jgi:hypothetical protein